MRSGATDRGYGDDWQRTSRKERAAHARPACVCARRGADRRPAARGRRDDRDSGARRDGRNRARARQCGERRAVRRNAAPGSAPDTGRAASGAGAGAAAGASGAGYAAQPAGTMVVTTVPPPALCQPGAAPGLRSRPHECRNRIWRAARRSERDRDGRRRHGRTRIESRTAGPQPAMTARLAAARASAAPAPRAVPVSANPAPAANAATAAQPATPPGQQDPESIRRTALAFLQQQVAGLPARPPRRSRPRFRAKPPRARRSSRSCRPARACGPHDGRRALRGRAAVDRLPAGESHRAGHLLRRRAPDRARRAAFRGRSPATAT